MYCTALNSVTINLDNMMRKLKKPKKPKLSLAYQNLIRKYTLKNDSSTLRPIMKFKIFTSRFVFWCQKNGNKII